MRTPGNDTDNNSVARNTLLAVSVWTGPYSASHDAPHGLDGRRDDNRPDKSGPAGLVEGAFMSARYGNYSQTRNVEDVRGDIRVKSASDRKAELRRLLLADLLADAIRDARHYVKNYTVGRGAE